MYFRFVLICILTGHVELVHHLGKVLLILLLHGDTRLDLGLLLLQYLPGAVVERQERRGYLLLVPALIRLGLLWQTQFAEDLAPDGLNALLLHHLQVQCLACGHATHASHRAQDHERQERQPHGVNPTVKSGSYHYQFPFPATSLSTWQRAGILGGTVSHPLYRCE